MSTHLQIVNRVLRRLREDEVTAITDTDYSVLIGQFVVDTHYDVMEAWPWHYGIQTVDFTTIAGTTGYNVAAKLSAGGSVQESSHSVNERSVLLVRTDGLPQSHISASSTTDKMQMILLSDEQRHDVANRMGTSTADYPTHISARKDSTNTWGIQLWPTPSVTGRFIRQIWYIPETELQVDGTTDATEIRTPNQPIYLGALWLALNERGEEIGEPGNMAEQAYVKALADAKERAIKYEESTGRFDWFR